ncbi:helix-turn-helix transcriptional regulator [Candidatus Ventrimonas sp. KK005]
MMTCIQRKRAVRGMTQQELADAAGISRTCLSLIETGMAEPKIETMKKVGEALGVRWQELVEE